MSGGDGGRRHARPECWLATTEPGLERLLGEDVREAGASCVEAAGPGVLVARVDGHAFDWATLRLARDVARVDLDTRIASLDDARAAAAKAVVPELDGATSFRVVGSRTGEALFTARELAGAVGAALQRRHGTPVDLESPAVVVRAESHGSRLLVGWQPHATSLARRLHRAPGPRAVLRTTVAAALVRLAGAHVGRGRLLDAACGVGTIPVEAAERNPELDVLASDWDAPTLEAARATFAAHGLSVETRLGDARALAATWADHPLSHVVLDPPHGLRLGRRTHLATLYAEIARSAVEALPEGGVFAWVSPRRRALERAVEGLPLEPIASAHADIGDLVLRLVALRRI